MSNASIPVDEDTKRLLEELKPADESWDAFLRRTTLAEEPIETGFLSEDGSDAVREEIKNRERAFEMLFLDSSAIIAYNDDIESVVEYVDGREPLFTSAICV